VTKFGLTVSLARAIGPILKPLNRELARRNAPVVSKQEYSFVDDALHEEQIEANKTAMRCPHCGGHLQPETGSGDYTCLICSRSSQPRRDIDQLAVRIADRVIEHRKSDD
jgi:hypothetical protein